jgi:DNA-binding NtrC family response regulator
VNSAADDSKPVTPETILVLDGDVLVRWPIAQYLRDCGYRVFETATAEEAMTILQKPAIHVDVVLSDVELPGSMNGFGFAQWARSGRPGLKIILVGRPERTAHAAAELCEDGPLLMKPYDHKFVLDHIKRLLAARERQGD